MNYVNYIAYCGECFPWVNKVVYVTKVSTLRRPCRSQFTPAAHGLTAFSAARGTNLLSDKTFLVAVCIHHLKFILSAHQPE